VWACEHFRHYLIGTDFTVMTDHRSLKWLFETTKAGRLNRWAMRLQEYQFTLLHKSGIQNGNADYWSRLPQYDPKSLVKMPSRWDGTCDATATSTRGRELAPLADTEEGTDAQEDVEESSSSDEEEEEDEDLMVAMAQEDETAPTIECFQQPYRYVMPADLRESVGKLVGRHRQQGVGTDQIVKMAVTVTFGATLGFWEDYAQDAQGNAILDPNPVSVSILTRAQRKQQAAAEPVENSTPPVATSPIRLGHREDLPTPWQAPLPTK
jgi:hypothetical protein